MTLRYCLPRVAGRGAGLGNELIPWARSFLAAQVLDAVCLAPAFGMNTRRYWRHFGTPRYDWLTHRALTHVLPQVQFSEADYLRHGGGDFIDAFKPFAEEHNLKQRNNFVLVTDGMWGGHRHVAAARDFVYCTLYRSRFAARNLLSIQTRLDSSKVTVAMHVRFGDFGGTPAKLEDYRGKFNLSLPLQWYRNIATSIQRSLGNAVQFLVVSDGTREQLQPLLAGLDAITTSDLPDSDCSDLLALANADLLVCSVSSFSSTAAYLSTAPYLWFEPNLQQHPEGFYSIWGHEKAQKEESGSTLKSWAAEKKSGQFAAGRGRPIDLSGEVPPGLLQDLLNAKNLRRQDADLIQYGTVTRPTVDATVN